jgi:hypothetical protein
LAEETAALAEYKRSFARSFVAACGDIVISGFSAALRPWQVMTNPGNATVAELNNAVKDACAPAGILKKANGTSIGDFVLKSTKEAARVKALQDQSLRKLDALSDQIKDQTKDPDGILLKSIVDSTPSHWKDALRAHREIVLEYKKIIAVCDHDQLEQCGVFGPISAGVKLTEAAITEGLRSVFCKEVIHCVGELVTHIQETETQIEDLTVEACLRLVKVSSNLALLDVRGCFVQDAAENAQVQIQEDRLAFVKELCTGFTACWKYSLRYRVAFNAVTLQAFPQPQP